MSGYVPVAIFGALIVGFGVVSLAAAALLRPSRPDIVKLMNYECGAETIGPRKRQRIRLRAEDRTVQRRRTVSFQYLDSLSAPDALQIGSAIKRGDGSHNAKPAVIIGIQKQPAVNTLELTRRIDATLL